MPTNNFPQLIRLCRMSVRNLLVIDDGNVEEIFQILLNGETTAVLIEKALVDADLLLVSILAYTPGKLLNQH